MYVVLWKYSWTVTSNLSTTFDHAEGWELCRSADALNYFNEVTLQNRIRDISDLHECSVEAEVVILESKTFNSGLTLRFNHETQKMKMEIM